MIEISQEIKYDGFGGIRIPHSHTDPKAAQDILNFRIGSDGSLTVREGFRSRFNLPYDIRAIWTGVFEGSLCCFVLSNVDVYELSMTSSNITHLGHVRSSSGEADFFFYGDTLYLIDGSDIWIVDRQAIYIPSGYVPLVADGWSDNQLGKINEPRNILNSRARFNYIISATESSVLMLDDYISRVDALYINGSPVSSDRYTIGVYAPYINVSGLAEGDRVSAYVTYRNASGDLSALCSNTRAYVFGGVNTSRVFLFGGDAPSEIYAGSYVSAAALEECRKVYPSSDNLYFGIGCNFCVGDGRYPVTNLCRHYDRLLIFTEKNAWRADSSVSGYGEFPTMSINTAVGALSMHGAALLGNNPYTVGDGGIYVWTSDTDEQNDCNAHCISDDIAPRLTHEFCKSARIFADRKNRCIYVCAPNVDTRVWVYEEDMKLWTSFDGILPSLSFETEDSTGFIDGTRMYVLDPELYTDSGTPIKVRYIGGICDMGSTRRKHINGISLSYDGGIIFCDVCKDSTSLPRTVFFSGDIGTHLREYKRINVGRTKSFYICIKAAYNGKLQIHSLCVKLR